VEIQMSKDTAPYEVGYGKPPKASRFRPGQSGNPAGRPRGSKNSKPGHPDLEKMKALFLEEAYRPVQIRDGERTLEVPMILTTLRSLLVNAGKGQVRQQRMAIDLLQAIEGEKRTSELALFETLVEHKRFWTARIAEARRLGQPEPNPLPHPDEIIIDPFFGSVMTTGPWTPEEKQEQEELRARKGEFQAMLAETEAQREATPDAPDLALRAQSLRSVLRRADKFLDFRRVILSGES
jgi:hypothetical protein